MSDTSNTDHSGGPAIGRARLRREARERAVELAYEQIQRDMTVDELVATLTLEPEAFTDHLLRASEEHRERADEIVSARLRGWTHERLPVMDQLVLRLATVELMTTDTPTGVVLAEAVDMASRYSTEESSKFVNGVLSAVAKQVRPEN